MVQLYTNFAESTLQQSAEAADTTLFIDPTEAADFPSPSGGDFFVATIFDQRNSSTRPEIVHCTSRVGGQLTVQRAQESTSAQLWPAGSRLYLSVTAATIAALLGASGARDTWTGVATGTTNYTLTVTGDLPLPTNGDLAAFVIPNTSNGNVTLTIFNGVSNFGPFPVHDTDGVLIGGTRFQAGFFANLRWVEGPDFWQATAFTSTQIGATAINSGPINSNIVSNGDLARWDQGFTFNTPADGVETANAWVVGFNGTSGTFTVSAQAFAPGQTDVDGQPKWFWRWDQTVASVGSTARNFRNRIRAHNRAQWRNAEQVTMSVWMKADSPRTAGMTISQNFGTGGAPSGTTAQTLNVNLTTSWQRFTHTVTLASCAGKTIGTNDDDYISVGIDLPVNTTLTVDVAMLQLEPGGRASEPWSPWPVPPAYGGFGVVGSTLDEILSKVALNLRTALLTVDGAGSLLDADFLDGLSAADFVRLSGSVTETITGQKTFSNVLTIFSNKIRVESTSFPQVALRDTDAGVDEKVWAVITNGGLLTIVAVPDAEVGGSNAVSFARTGTTIGAANWSVTQHLSVAGSAGAPTYAFSGDPNTGFFSAGADIFGISAGGTNRFQVSTTAITYTIPLLGAAGSAGAPTYSFSGDPNTGIYNSAADEIAFATNGTNRWIIGSGGNITAVGDFAVRTGDGTVGSPTHSFANDTDCGLYRIGANNIGISANSVLVAEWDNVQFVLSDIGPTRVFAAGLRGTPTVTHNATYELVLGDAGKTMLHDETSARTWTIPANASVAFPIGTTIVIDNTGNAGGAPGTLTIAITSDTLRRGDAVAGTGSRTVAANGVAVIRKTKSTEWVITGSFT